MSAASSISFGADTVMTGFDLAFPSLPFSISMLVAVALCVKSKGLDTSKDMDFCGRRIRSAPLLEEDGLSESVDGGLDKY